MEFAAECKSLWPISSSFSPPLLLSPEKANLGPLTFTPNPDIPTTTLLHSTSIAPNLPPPYPILTLPLFIEKYDSIPSHATSISSLLGPQLPDFSSNFHSFNSLQLLRVPDKDLVIAFFPAGENCDLLGYSVLAVKDGILSSIAHRKDFFHLVEEHCGNHQRIRRILVNTGVVYEFDTNKPGNNVVIGFVMVCTDYSVCWYRVEISSSFGRSSVDDNVSVSLIYVGCADSKMLKGNLVVNACWSPHLGEECLVLLQNGDTMLFDVKLSCPKKSKILNLVTGSAQKKMQLSSVHKVRLKEEVFGQGEWVACEFSWHPRVFLVTHSTVVFLVDLRKSVEKCKVSCLLKLEMLSMVKNDGFLSLSRAGPDGFLCTVATRCLLLLFDVRKPLVPVLRWGHKVKNPWYMTVFRLSELRANVKGSKYQEASEWGYCILLGSFWDNDFSMFCYGPDCSKNGSVSSEISKFCNSYYAWGLPSEFPLYSHDCNCGSCLVREEFFKVSLPIWIDWRQKRHLTLGFGILDSDLSAKLSTHDSSSGGFVLVRLSSSGKLDALRYDAVKNSKVGHKRKRSSSDDNLLYTRHNLEYDGRKIFQHMKFGFLNAFAKDELAKCIIQRIEKKAHAGENGEEKKKIKPNSNFHEEICRKLKDFGLKKNRSSVKISDLLKDISLPTSINEIATRSIWTTLPTNLLRLAFSTYSNFHKVYENENEPLEFLTIPDQLQLPPFPSRKPSIRSNRWSSKVQPYDTLIGPLLPSSFMATLHYLQMQEAKNERDLYLERTFSVLSQLKHQCDEVIKVVQERVLNSNITTEDDDCVSLGDDVDNISCKTPNLKLSYHKPSAFVDNSSVLEGNKFGFQKQAFSTHIFRRNQEFELSAEMVGPELFDVGCPIELKFDDSDVEFGQKELDAYRSLKKQELNFQRSYKPYQDYVTGGSKQK